MTKVNPSEALSLKQFLQEGVPRRGLLGPSPSSSVVQAAKKSQASFRVASQGETVAFMNDCVFDGIALSDSIVCKLQESSDQPIPSTIGELRNQQASSHLRFLGDRLKLPEKPILNSGQFESYADFEEANSSYLAQAKTLQKDVYALHKEFVDAFNELQSENNFQFDRILSQPTSLLKLTQIVASLKIHSSYPEHRQAIDFMKRVGRFMTKKVPAVDPQVNNKHSSSDAVGAGSNCYAYASAPARSGSLKLTPGGYSGKPIAYSAGGKFDPIQVIEALVSDGLSLTPLKDSYPIYLVLSDAVPGDYHFFREDADGVWSHKPGGRRAKRTDLSERLITNPLKLDLRNRGYYYPICFFWVSKNFDAPA